MLRSSEFYIVIPRYTPSVGRFDINNYDLGGVTINLHEGTGAGTTEGFNIRYDNDKKFEVTYDGKVGVNRSGATLTNNFEVGGDTYIENTAEHYVIVLEENGMWTKAIIKMKSTQLKKSRTWNSIMSNQRRVDGDEVYQPKDFARSYVLKTIREKNDKGKWFGWVISEGDWIDELKISNVEKIYEDAMLFEKQIHSGEIDSTPQKEDSENEVQEKDGSEIF